jgi:hypothetical protein
VRSLLHQRVRWALTVMLAQSLGVGCGVHAPAPRLCQHCARHRQGRLVDAGGARSFPPPGGCLSICSIQCGRGLAADERDAQIQDDLQYNKINVFPFILDDADVEDEDELAVDQKLKVRVCLCVSVSPLTCVFVPQPFMPFAVVGSNDFITTPKGARVCGRQNKWGFVEGASSIHRLRSALIQVMLRSGESGAQ